MNEIIIFTDGSSSGNPGPGGWAALITLPDNTIKEFGGREERTTNNRMELQAACEALKAIQDVSGDVIINTDSSYLIQGITKWIHGWIRNKWITSIKTEVANREIWEELISLLEDREEKGTIFWKHIAGHSGVPGNERVDEIATSYTFQKPITLYNGPKENYGIDLSVLIPDVVKKEIKDEKRARSKQKAYSYVSMVNGKIETHATWAECEARVKGKSNTKFKKSFSKEDEKNIIDSWKLL